MPDLKPSHNHWRRKCAICNGLMGWCKCSGTSPDSGSMVTLHGIYQKCVDAALIKKDSSSFIELKRLGYYFNEKKELRIDPTIPLQFKEFMFSALDFFYYWTDQYEIMKKYTGEYTEAGNFMRYKFIPKNEIWIDISLPWNEVCLAISHESLESRTMQLSLQYDPAHLQAQKIEDYCRQNVAGKPGANETYVDTLLSDSGIG